MMIFQQKISIYTGKCAVISKSGSKKMQITFERNLLFYAFEEKFRREENNLPALIYSGKFLEFVSEP